MRMPFSRRVSPAHCTQYGSWRKTSRNESSLDVYKSRSESLFLSRKLRRSLISSHFRFRVSTITEPPLTFRCHTDLLEVPPTLKHVPSPVPSYNSVQATTTNQQVHYCAGYSPNLSSKKLRRPPRFEKGAAGEGALLLGCN